MKTNGYYLLITIAHSAVSALIASVAAVIVYLSVIVESLVEPEIIGSSFGLFLYGVINALCCFFFVRHHPISIWFVPLIMNVFVIAIIFWEPGFWRTSLWIPVCSGWILCIIASILGMRIGSRAALTPLEN